jgi:hypothetical protein
MVSVHVGKGRFAAGQLTTQLKNFLQVVGASPSFGEKSKKGIVRLEEE